MRPIKLSMTAFGSYEDKTVIEMDKLGKDGLYLITGETGAGKTVIFDAIVFALYGKTSSIDRSAKLLCKQPEKKSVKSEVELVFSYADEVYTAKRWFKKYDGTEPEATLYLPDKNVVTGHENVTKKIIDIIGVDREQFLQIAMIAQGAFRDLLVKSTAERMEILRRIFKTKLYGDLQEKLSAQMKKIGEELEGVFSRVRQYVKDIRVEEESEFFGEVCLAKENGLQASETLELLNKLILADSEGLKKVKGEIEEIDNRLKEIAGRLGKIELREKTRILLDETKEMLAREKEGFADLSRDFEEAKAVAPEIEKISAEKAAAEAELAHYDAVNRLEINVKSSEKTLSEKQNQLKKNEELWQKNSEILNNLGEELKSLSNADENRQKLIGEKEKAEERQSKLNRLGELLEMYDDKRELISNILETEKLLTEKICGLKANREKLEDELRQDREGAIAQELAEGKPCPVCGSLVHPCPAKRPEGAPTEAQLKQAKKDEEKALEAAQKKREELAGAESAAKVLREDIEKRLEIFAQKVVVESAGEVVESEKKELLDRLAEINEEISGEEKSISRKKSLEVEIAEKTEELKNLDGQIDALKNEISGLVSEIETKKTQLENDKKELCFDSKKTALEHIEGLEKTVAEMKERKKAAEDKYNTSLLKITGFEEKIKGLEPQLSEEGEMIDKEAENENKARLDEEKKKAQERLDEINERLTLNTNARDGIVSAAKNLGALEKRYSMVKPLSETAGGQVKGKEKMLLETYVQMTYFERIIDRANIRLLEMSGGRFELKRREENSNIRNQVGLDLDVIDYRKSKTRDVKTLSGGESFMAALSLALGISDEIQASAGGVKLDAMFVDEGFGSLDEKSLDDALNALAKLSDGNKLVGVISHVDVLKRRIGRQIVVSKKTDGGSTAKIVFD